MLKKQYRRDAKSYRRAEKNRRGYGRLRSRNGKGDEPESCSGKCCLLCLSTEKKALPGRKNRSGKVADGPRRDATESVKFLAICE